MVTKKNIKINENDISAKSSENYISVKIGCMKNLDSYRFLDASSICRVQAGGGGGG